MTDGLLLGSGEEIMTGPDLATRLEIYKNQVRVRYFEKKVYNLFLEGLVRGTTHLGAGQEAVSAGVSAALRSDDYVFATYRGHAPVIMRGASMSAVLGEMLGVATGLMGGKGGSMHLTDAEHYFMGCYAIVGAHLTIANGAAWSAVYRGTDQVAVAFFGDGATNIGAFHESLNLAAIWKLPVVFVCENNLYQEYTPIQSVTAVAHPAADRASAYGLEPVLVDGNDADAVFTVAARAVRRARNGEGPSLVEALTYRHGGHSRADPGKYRPEEEVKAWLERDPIPLYRARLESLGVGDKELGSIEIAAAEEVELATQKALAAPPADPSTIWDDVFADGWSWRR